MGRFGDIIKTRMKRRGISVEELAHRSGVSANTISRARNLDEPSFRSDVLDRIADALGTTATSLRSEHAKVSGQDMSESIDRAQGAGLMVRHYELWAVEPWQQTDECRRAYLAGAADAIRAVLLGG